MPASRRHPKRGAILLLLLLLGLAPTAAAQLFNAERYLDNCLQLERGGDYETAKQSCLNALASEPDLARARLALGRIELALGNLAAAESNLRQARDSLSSPEPLLLLADVLIRGKRFEEAGAALQEAARRIQAGDRSWAGEHAYLEGVLEETRGNFTEALGHFQEAVRLEPQNRAYRLRLASLQFEMGQAVAAQSVLRTYLDGRGGQIDADIGSLLGRTYWAQGELAAAATELEAALARRASQGPEQARDLRALALVYYGLGNYQAGGLALREAMLRGNPLETFFSGNLPWLLLLLLLLAVHLVGESRVGATSSAADTSVQPRPWTVGQVYGIAWAGLLTGLPVAVAYGYLQYENLLALVTPVQTSDTLAVFFGVFSLVVAVGAWRRAVLNGWSPTETLLSGGERLPAGIMLGLALLAATFAYRIYVPQGPWRGELFLDLAHITPAVAAGMLLIPLSELFFRPFAFPALENRYGGALALLISGSLSALVLATPIVLLLAMGLILTSAYRSTRSGALTFAAQLTLHVGLLLAILLSPLARSMFV